MTTPETMKDCFFTEKTRVFFLRVSLAGTDPGFSERGSDKRPPTLYNCLILLFNKSFFTRESMVKIFAFVSL